jgi:hypothetical protein
LTELNDVAWKFRRGSENNEEDVTRPRDKAAILETAAAANMVYEDYFFGK